MTKILNLFFLLLPVVCYSQNDTLYSFDNKRNRPLWGKEITNSLLMGANHQSRGDTVSSKENRWFAEIGIHRTSMFYAMHGPSKETVLLAIEEMGLLEPVAL